jgi:uncharacterized protein YbaP (TraB family)
MDAHDLTFEAAKRIWSGEREAVNFFARHSGVELEFIVTRSALMSVGNLTAALNEQTALLTFDNYEDVFLEAAIRVWKAAGDTQPVYFINDTDVMTRS